MQALNLLRLAGVGRLVRMMGHVLAKALQWDVAVLSVLLTGLASVLWLRWQRQRTRERHHSHRQ